MCLSKHPNNRSFTSVKLFQPVRQGESGIVYLKNTVSSEITYNKYDSKSTCFVQRNIATRCVVYIACLTVRTALANSINIAADSGK